MRSLFKVSTNALIELAIHQFQGECQFFMSIIFHVHTGEAFTHHHCILRSNIESGVVPSNYSKHDLLVGVLLTQLLGKKKDSIKKCVIN